MMCPKQANDLTGMKFGKLTVKGRAPTYISPTGRRVIRWYCSCDCGNEAIVYGPNMKKGDIKSCGCLRGRPTHAGYKRHDMAGTKQYRAWASMLQRCENPHHTAYAYYGGRGIRVCEEWHDFTVFWRDMQEGFEEGLQIDRIDPEGNYGPGNCRWVSRSTNQQNTRRARKVHVEPYGVITLKVLSELTSIPYATLGSRYRGRRPILREDECVRFGISLKEETHD